MPAEYLHPRNSGVAVLHLHQAGVGSPQEMISIPRWMSHCRRQSPSKASSDSPPSMSRTRAPASIMSCRRNLTEAPASEHWDCIASMSFAQQL